MLITTTTYVAKCDYCYTEYKIEKGNIAYPKDDKDNLIHPPGWYILITGTNAILHFHTFNCLDEWMSSRGSVTSTSR